MLAAVCSLSPVSRAPAALPPPTPPPPPTTHCHSASPPFLTLLLPVRSIPSTSSPSCYGLLCKSVGSLFSFYCEPDFLAWQTEGGKNPRRHPPPARSSTMRPAGGGGGGCRVERTVHTPGLRILQHGAQPDKNTFIRLWLIYLVRPVLLAGVCVFL